MSIVVAVKKGRDIVVAADSQSMFGPTLRVRADNHRAVKIRQIGRSYVATTGWGLYDNILDDFWGAGRAPDLRDEKSIFTSFLKLWKALHQKYHLVKDTSDEDDDHSPFGDLDATFLIVNRNGIFQVSCDMSVTKFENYCAIGAGSDFSYGALFTLYDGDHDAEALAVKAVEAAITFNASCGGEIRVKKIKAGR